jgi:DeoR/GlpR family transcriptional regulator of sugar metabolism
MVYKNEHNRLIDALAKAKGISIAQLAAMYKSSMKEVYKDLYTTDNQTRANALY